MNSETGMTTKIGILTVSDRASRGQYDDLSGPSIVEALNSYLSSPWQACYQLVEDEQPLIESALCNLCKKDYKIAQNSTRRS